MDLYRIARALHLRGVPLVPRLIQRATLYLHSSVVPYEAQIGDGTQLGYGGLGVVIHPEASIGRNVFIGPHVVIGGRSQRPGAPRIEDDVLIGAGAKVLGAIHVRRSSVIGANAVVLSDVAEGAVMVGAPARQLRVVERGGRWWDSEAAAAVK